VDRRRVRLAFANRRERATGDAELDRFRVELAALDRIDAAEPVDPIRECDPALEAVE
jgi:hypothetical protein